MRTRWFKIISLIVVLTFVTVLGAWVFSSEVNELKVIHKMLKEQQQIVTNYFGIQQQANKTELDSSIEDSSIGKKSEPLETLHEMMAKISICR